MTSASVRPAAPRVTLPAIPLRFTAARKPLQQKQQAAAAETHTPLHARYTNYPTISTFSSDTVDDLPPAVEGYHQISWQAQQLSNRFQAICESLRREPEQLPVAEEKEDRTDASCKATEPTASGSNVLQRRPTTSDEDTRNAAALVTTSSADDALMYDTAYTFNNSDDLQAVAHSPKSRKNRRAQQQFHVLTEQSMRSTRGNFRHELAKADHLMHQVYMNELRLELSVKDEDDVFESKTNRHRQYGHTFMFGSAERECVTPGSLLNKQREKEGHAYRWLGSQQSSRPGAAATKQRTINANTSDSDAKVKAPVELLAEKVQHMLRDAPQHQHKYSELNRVLHTLSESDAQHANDWMNDDGSRRGSMRASSELRQSSLHESTLLPDHAAQHPTQHVHQFTTAPRFDTSAAINTPAPGTYFLEHTLQQYNQSKVKGAVEMKTSVVIKDTQQPTSMLPALHPVKPAKHTPTPLLSAGSMFDYSTVHHDDKREMFVDERFAIGTSPSNIFGKAHRLTADATRVTLQNARALLSDANSKSAEMVSAHTHSVHVVAAVASLAAQQELEARKHLKSSGQPRQSLSTVADDEDDAGSNHTFITNIDLSPTMMRQPSMPELVDRQTQRAIEAYARAAALKQQRTMNTQEEDDEINAFAAAVPDHWMQIIATASRLPILESVVKQIRSDAHLSATSLVVRAVLMIQRKWRAVLARQRAKKERRAIAILRANSKFFLVRWRSHRKNRAADLLHQCFRQILNGTAFDIALKYKTQKKSVHQQQGITSILKHFRQSVITIQRAYRVHRLKHWVQVEVGDQFVQQVVSKYTSRRRQLVLTKQQSSESVSGRYESLMVDLKSVSKRVVEHLRHDQLMFKDTAIVVQPLRLTTPRHSYLSQASTHSLLSTASRTPRTDRKKPTTADRPEHVATIINKNDRAQYIVKHDVRDDPRMSAVGQQLSKLLQQTGITLTSSERREVVSAALVCKRQQYVLTTCKYLAMLREHQTAEETMTNRAQRMLADDSNMQFQLYVNGGTGNEQATTALMPFLNTSLTEEYMLPMLLDIIARKDTIKHKNYVPVSPSKLKMAGMRSRTPKALSSMSAYSTSTLPKMELLE